MDEVKFDLAYAKKLYRENNELKTALGELVADVDSYFQDPTLEGEDALSETLERARKVMKGEACQE